MTRMRDVVTSSHTVVSLQDFIHLLPKGAERLLAIKSIPPSSVAGSRTGSWLLNYGLMQSSCLLSGTLHCQARGLSSAHPTPICKIGQEAACFCTGLRDEGEHESLLGLDMRQQLSVFFPVFARNSKKQFKCSVAYICV